MFLLLVWVPVVAAGPTNTFQWGDHRLVGADGSCVSGRGFVSRQLLDGRVSAIDRAVTCGPEFAEMIRQQISQL